MNEVYEFAENVNVATNQEVYMNKDGAIRNLISINIDYSPDVQQPAKNLNDEKAFDIVCDKVIKSLRDQLS